MDYKMDFDMFNELQVHLAKILDSVKEIASLTQLAEKLLPQKFPHSKLIESCNEFSELINLYLKGKIASIQLCYRTFDESYVNQIQQTLEQEIASFKKDIDSIRIDLVKLITYTNEVSSFKNTREYQQALFFINKLQAKLTDVNALVPSITEHTQEAGKAIENEENYVDWMKFN